MDENRNEVGGGQLIAGYLGIILMLIGGIILLPIMLLAVYPEESVYASCFTIPGVTAILTGYVMSLFIRGRDKLEAYWTSGCADRSVFLAAGNSFFVLFPLC